MWGEVFWKGGKERTVRGNRRKGVMIKWMEGHIGSTNCEEFTQLHLRNIRPRAAFELGLRVQWEA